MQRFTLILLLLFFTGADAFIFIQPHNWSANISNVSLQNKIATKSKGFPLKGTAVSKIINAYDRQTNVLKPKKLEDFYYEPREVILDDTIRITYTNNINQMSTQITQSIEIWKNNAWSLTSKYTYLFVPESSMLISELYQGWSDNKLLYAERYTYDYKDYSNLTVVGENLSGDKWVNFFKQIVTTENPGYSNTCLYQKWENNTWVDSSKESNFTENGGQTAISLSELWKNNKWETIRKSTEVKIDEFCTVDYSEGWSYDSIPIYYKSRSTSYYNKNYNLDSMMNELWVNNDWINAFKIINYYDSSGVYIGYIDQIWANGWVNNYKEIYSKSSSANTKTMESLSWIDNSWANGYKFVYKLNTNGSIIDELNYFWLNNNWVPQEKYNYIYDNNGNAISGEYKVLGDYPYLLETPYLQFSANNNETLNTFKAYKGTVKYNTPTAVKDKTSTINTFTLQQNYPNPFNPSTSINYTLPGDSHVTLKVYDVMGKEICTLVDKAQPAGDYKTEFNGSSYASGIYFYRLTAGSLTQVRKMILLR